MIYRDETAVDAAPIGDLVTAAFLNAPHRGGTEALIVTRLRAAGGLLLSLVAEEEGRLLGHVAASPASLDGAAGWACIAPLSVLPGRQGQGIGTALMQAALQRLRAQGHDGVVLVGDPAYYARFGLKARPRLVADGLPPEVVLSLPLRHGAALRGGFGFHPAFGL